MVSTEKKHKFDLVDFVISRFSVNVEKLKDEVKTINGRLAVLEHNDNVSQ